MKFFGTSRNSPITGILHTVSLCHVYRSVWTTREAKPRSGAVLECSAHDCDTRLYNFKIAAKGIPHVEHGGNPHVVSVKTHQDKKQV